MGERGCRPTCGEVCSSKEGCLDTSSRRPEDSPEVRFEVGLTKGTRGGRKSEMSPCLLFVVHVYMKWGEQEGDQIWGGGDGVFCELS